MDFVHWWFDDHYIISTVLTPLMTAAWCVYTESLLRGLVAGALALVAFLWKVSVYLSAHEH